MQTEAVRARNESQLNQPPSDSARRSQNVPAGQELPVRLSPTVTDCRNALDFPDTEEVTGSNPVRPTTFFEIVSSGESHNESQPPAVLSLRCWSERIRLRPHRRLSRAWRPYRWISRPAVAVTGTRFVSRRARVCTPVIAPDTRSSTVQQAQCDASADPTLRRAGHRPKLAREQPLTAN
jgi:hypothetical protein